MRLRVLYTKHLIKKAKTWHDGVITIAPDQHTLVLRDESSAVLASARCPPGLQLPPAAGDTEPLSCFEGFIVEIDGLEESEREAGFESCRPHGAASCAAQEHPRPPPSSLAPDTVTPGVARRPQQPVRRAFTQHQPVASPGVRTAAMQTDAGQLGQQRVGSHDGGWGKAWRHSESSALQGGPTTACTSTHKTACSSLGWRAGDLGAAAAPEDEHLLSWLGVDANDEDSAGLAETTPPSPASRSGIGMPSRPAEPWQHSKPLDRPMQPTASLLVWPASSEDGMDGSAGMLEDDAIPHPSQARATISQRGWAQPQATGWRPQAAKHAWGASGPGHPWTASAQGASDLSRDPERDEEEPIGAVERLAAAHLRAGGWGQRAGEATGLAQQPPSRSGGSMGSHQALLQAGTSHHAGVPQPVQPAPPTAWRAPVQTAAAQPRLAFQAPRQHQRRTGPGPPGPGPPSPQPTAFAGIAMPSIVLPRMGDNIPVPQAAPTRSVAIPTEHASVAAYLACLRDAAAEEVALRLAEAAALLQAQVTAAAAHTNPAPGGGPAQPLATLAQAIERACTRSGVPYFAAAQLSSFVPYVGQGKRQSSGGGPARHNAKRTVRDRRTCSADDEDGGEEAGVDSDGENKEAPAAQRRFFLTVPGARTRHKDYRKHDLWVLGAHPLLNPGGSPAAAVGRVRPSQPPLLVRALWHAPDKDGKMEVAPLEPLAAGSVAKSQAVCAWRGPDVQSELHLLQLLYTAGLAASSGRSALPPVLPHLLHPCQQPSYTLWDVKGEEGPGQFQPNADQWRVVEHVASWLLRPLDTPPAHGMLDQAAAAATLHSPSMPQAPLQSPVCLIHGPFGSGKSQLLASLITLLAAARGLPDSPAVRVLVVSHTNVAVDRILVALQERGFTSFLRVGALQRMARAVLPRSLHAADDSRDAQTQLRAMLADETVEAEKAVLQMELAALQAGAERKRRALLATCPVVGSTCAALMQADTLWEQAGRFSIVVLDEASQVTEPVSVVPLLKAKASFLIAAGDPAQLPPVIASPARLGPTVDAARHGLLRPLFVRLRDLGHPVHLLRTQYRCHPAIAAVPNAAFYAGSLTDGCGPEQRAALAAVPELPALTFCELPSDAAAAMDPVTRSSYNLSEAHHAVGIVRALLARGVAAPDIGVICFYRAQAARIKAALQQGGANGEPNSNENRAAGAVYTGAAVQVATVDSFQGAEKELIILATTATRRTDFASDACRLNVALTRARRHLVVLGVSRNLAQASPAFAQLIARCRDPAAPTTGYYGVASLPIGRPDGAQD